MILAPQQKGVSVNYVYLYIIFKDFHININNDGYKCFQVCHVGMSTYFIDSIKYAWPFRLVHIPTKAKIP